jgi:hypothetical protein
MLSKPLVLEIKGGIIRVGLTTQGLTLPLAGELVLKVIRISLDLNA